MGYCESWSKVTDERDKLIREARTKGAKLCRHLSRKLGVREVARRIGVSPTYVSNVNHGTANLSPSAYCKLLQVEDEKMKQE